MVNAVTARGVDPRDMPISGKVRKPETADAEWCKRELRYSCRVLVLLKSALARGVFFSETLKYHLLVID